jgi:hypothetical protein
VESDDADGGSTASEAAGINGDTMADHEDEAGIWGGHAWTVVNIDGAWYHIDPTFDDPIGNPAGQVSHFYFGQTDDVMSGNHRWADGYFPESKTEDFLFYKKSGLYAEDWEGFEAIVTDILSETPVASLEAAVVGETINEENIQFIYQLRDDIEMIRWGEQTWGDVHVQSLELYYS